MPICDRSETLRTSANISSIENPPRNYLPLRSLDWRLVLAVFAAILTCLFFYRQLDYVANGAHRSPLLTFTEEAVGTLAGFAIFPLAYLSATRFSLLSPRWRSHLGLQLVALCLISLVHTTLIVVLRHFFFPPLGLYDGYGSLRARYPMEFAHLFIFYWLGVALIYLFHEIRFARDREIRHAQLETRLAETQLQNLRLQLEPHFLFNVLNAISAAIYDSPRAADEMVCRLSDLLRQLLKEDRSQEIPLAREIELLQLYTRIMQARLEDRLHIDFSIQDTARSALVPQLLLQPLVENAIRHGLDPLTFQARIHVSAHVENDRLSLKIRDHGPGFDLATAPRSGIGLRNTRSRLQEIYRGAQLFEVRNAAEGGAVVSLSLPFRTGLSPAASEAISRAKREAVLPARR